MSTQKNEVAIRGNYDITTPSQMASMAVVLRKHIVSQNLFTNISGKNYAHVEGWAFAGGLIGMLPRLKRVENLSSGTEKKWLAEVEIVRVKDDKVIGLGVALCSNLEGKKKSFDEYAILSMAQTRAIGKAYRNLIGWVMKMAGYEATPKEEMTKVNDEPVKGEVITNAPVDDGLSGNYAVKLKAEVMAMNKRTDMTNKEIMEFINSKLETKHTKISSSAQAQMILAQLQLKMGAKK